MPTVRIDQEVYEWLQNQATAFEDTPNTVMRRIASLDHSTVVQKLANNKNKPGTGGPSVRGRQLAIRERLNVKKAYYHWEGTFFEKVREFPAALFDRFGYVVFDSEQKYLNDPKVFVGKKTNIPSRINTFTEYVKMSRPAF